MTEALAPPLSLQASAGKRMVGIPVVAGRSRVHRMFAPRAPVSAATEKEAQASPQSWLSELSAPDPLAHWASSFTDLKSCWNACHDPEWLLWLAARTCGSVEQREQVVLCAAELASAARRRGRDTDPRVTNAI